MLSMEDVYREHSHMVYQYLLSLSHDADLAEELTQETFYQAIKKLDYFNAESKVSTWLCGIAKNLFLSYCESTADRNIGRKTAHFAKVPSQK